MSSFKYGIKDRVGFYASYFWYKLILPLEVKSPRIKLWWYEFRYSMHKFRDYEFGLTWSSPIDFIRTRFGEFNIRVNTSDAANVSPAFERKDINILLRVIDQKVRAGKKVLFLDVGGDLGTFSVTVGNHFRTHPVDIMCFEPVPASSELVRKNVAQNGLCDKVSVNEMALMDTDTDALTICLNTLTPGSSSIEGEGEHIKVKGRRLDNVLASHGAEYDAVVIKLDVEGAEKHVLKGAENFLAKGIETTLMVEDFVDTDIIDFLEESGWVFQQKKTDYNSWWIKNIAAE